MYKSYHKIVSLLVTFAMLLVIPLNVLADGKKTFTLADVTENLSELKIDGDYFTLNATQSYFGIKGVDLTGIKSIGLTGKCSVTDWDNAEVFRIKVDDPMGKSIGFIAFNEYSPDSDITIRGNISEVSGVHTLYFVTTLIKGTGKWNLKGVTLYNDPLLKESAKDYQVIDNYSDTWACVDDYGRKVADYEETGGRKDGDHYVGMFYHNWHVHGDTNGNTVIPDVIRQTPEARNDYTNDAWGNRQSRMWWGEPVYGFYTSYDYWVYKKQAVLLANAGVDAIFPDYTNGPSCFVRPLKVLLDAFASCKKEGVNVPKVSAWCNMGKYFNNSFDQVMTLYYNVVADEKYSDLWFKWEGKPFVVSSMPSETDQSLINTQDADLVETIKKVDDLFIYRHMGDRGSSPGYDTDIVWLDRYPQPTRGVERADGRVESVTVGMALNESTIDNGATVGVFSDPYAKGKAFSEAFGEDYSADNGRKPYFFREQSALALDIDPAFVFIDGWNEWGTVFYSSYGAHKNAFVDLFDEENSRDFEPSRSYIKDDYYNLLCDFIRKYKGTRPAPVASEAKTIDINSGAAQWESVGPEFINDYDDFERDSIGYLDSTTGESLRYKTKVNNSISRAKVARDSNNLYFYVKTTRDIVTGTDGWMNLYINIDRNPKTGWNGYDYAVNKNGSGVISEYNGSGWNDLGNVSYTINGNVLQLAIPRNIIGENGTVDLEFKWTDGITSDDYLDFYSEGSCAPMGKFNYLYTEIEQTALTESERKALDNTTIAKAGSSKMIIDGGKVGVYEKDTRITPIEMNGTLYIPSETYEDILDYGNAKAEYDAESNIFYLARHDMSEDYSKITNYQWTYSVIGSPEARINGELRSLSTPVTVIDGIIYVPMTYVAETFGWHYQSLGAGAYVLSKNPIDVSLVQSVLHHIN